MEDANMFVNWWQLSSEVASANLAAQRVIALRLAKLAKGGPAAHREARRMIVEKVAASFEAGASLMAGKSSHAVVRRYGSIVRANERRLSGR
jgi:hypothetical protein